MSKAKKERKSTELDNSKYEILQKEIEKLYGKSAVIELTEETKEVKKVKTGNIALDYVLGGGWPKGRFVQVTGNQHVGKTSLLCQAIRRFQEEDDRPVLFFDAEQKMDWAYAEELGVDLSKDRLKPFAVDVIEEVGTICELYAKAGVSLIVIDSLASLIPKAEDENGMDKDHRGLTPRKLGAFFRKLKSIVNKSETMVLMTNQVRIAQGGTFSYETLAGGKQPGYYTAVILELSKPSDAILKNSEGEYGQKVEIRASKNQVGVAYRSATVNLIWGSGYDDYYSLADMACFAGTVKLSGSWITLDNGEKIQGKQQLAERLASDLELFDEIYKKTSNKLFKKNGD